MPAATDGLRVLIVEDEAIMAEVVGELLESLGHVPVGIAESGEEALRLATETRPDLALLDIKLKGEMDGIELARRLRDELGIRFVFATGSHDPQMRARAEATGPSGFLAKPFLPRHLAALLSPPPCP